MKKSIKIILSLLISVCLLLFSVVFLVVTKESVIADGKKDYISVLEGNATITEKTTPTINLTSNGGNVTFEFTQYISVDDMNGITPLIDFDLGVDSFETRTIQGIKIDICDSLDDSQLISVGITGRDSNPVNVGVSAGLDKGEISPYGIYYLENSSRTFYGCFYGGDYVPQGTHYAGYPNGDTLQPTTGPARFAFFYNNTVGSRELRVKGIYKPSVNILDQDYLVANFDSEDYTTAYFGDESKNVGKLFTSGYAKITIKVYALTSAKLNLYSIAGQEFNAGGFTNQGPKIYVSAKLNAIVGKKYALPTPFRIFDEMDNAEISNYSVNVLDSKGASISTSKDSFIPEKAGIYDIVYSAYDKGSNIGKKTLKIECYDKVPDIVFNGEATLNEKYALGESITVPKYTATSDLSLDDNKLLNVKTIIQKDNSVVASFDGDGDLTFKPTSTGIYSIFYVVDNYGLGRFFNGQSFEVNDEEPYISIDCENINVSLGESIFIEDAVVYYNGEKYSISPNVISPSGQTLGTGIKSLNCSETGCYKLQYRFEKDGFTEEKEVAIYCYEKISSLFVMDRIEEVVPEYALPDYAREYGKTGMFIKTASANSSFEFTNKIDLTKLNKNINLFSLLPYSDGGDYGMFYFQVELVDAVDPSNKVVISVNPHSEGLAQYSYVNVSYDGRTLARSTELNGGIMTSGYHGCLIESSFGTGYGRKDVPPFEIQYEIQENAFYVQTYYGNFGHWQLLDLDDPNQVGAGKEWKGFSTGEVYVRFIFNKLNTSKAGIILTQFAGLSFENNYVFDDIAPALKVIYPENYTLGNDGKLPDAKILKAYPLPSATAYDIVCGETNVEYKLYKQGNTNVNLYNSVIDGSFVPDQTGRYCYEIITKDFFDNNERYEFYFDVTNQDYSITVDFDNPENAYAGYIYNIPNITVEGGSGQVSYNITATLNGKNLVINANNQIFLNEKGTLRINVEASDYIGNSVSGKSYLDIQVNAYSEPVITVTGIPKYVFYGDDIVLNDFSAINYSYASTQKEYLPCRAIFVDGQQVYSVNGQVVTGSLVIKANKSPGQEVEIKFVTLDSQGAITKEHIEKVTVLATPKYISDFILATSQNGAVTVNRDNLGSKFSFNEDLELESIYPISTEKINLRFSTMAENVKITLIDYYNVTTQISFELKIIDGVTRLVYQNKIYSLSGSILNIEDLFTFVINADGSMYDGSGNSLCVLSKTDSGEIFNGFSRSCALLKINATSSSNGQFTLLQMGNQVFSANNSEDFYSDLSTPEIIVNGSVENLQEKGATILIPSAFAYDVICGITKVSIKITNPLGDVIKEYSDASIINGESFVATEYGYYTILYKAKDKNNKSSEQRLNVYVRDSEAPNVSIKGNVPSKINVGKEIVFPSAVVSDNNGEPQVYLLINKPSGSIVMLSESRNYTFNEKGHYRLIYYVYDKDYNIVTKIFNIIVE